MPSRADIEAATPKCPLEVEPRDFYAKRTVGKSAKRKCARPMVFSRDPDIWVCPVHGPAVTPSRLIARQTLVSA